MHVLRIVHLMAGVLVLTGVLLAHFVHPYWIGITVFVGANLVQWSFTGFCPAEIILRRLGVPDGSRSCP